MLEYLFRGKMTDEDYNAFNDRKQVCGDPWITGSLVHAYDDGEAFYILMAGIFSPLFKSHVLCGCYPYQVIPESVGQYVGKEDANGRKIFTGDILSVGGHPVAVQLRGTQFVALKKNGVPLSWMIATHGVVIGNVFDNPELLEKNL